MNSRMNEDLAWLRVQDMQREAENRRLMAAMRRSAGMTTGAAKLASRPSGPWQLSRLAGPELTRWRHR